MYQGIPTKTLTGEARLVNVNLVKPHVIHHDGSARYSATLLIPKTDAATIADIGASITAAAMAAGLIEDAFHFPIRDGDGNTPGGDPYEPECRGHWILPAATWRKPEIVNSGDLCKELPPLDIYGGMYGRVTLRFYGYKAYGAKGVDCELCNILKTRDGERIYSRNQLARAGVQLLRDAVKEKQGELMECLLEHLRKFDTETVQQLRPEQYGAFAAGLRALGAQI